MVLSLRNHWIALKLILMNTFSDLSTAQQCRLGTRLLSIIHNIGGIVEKNGSNRNSNRKRPNYIHNTAQFLR